MVGITHWVGSAVTDANTTEFREHGFTRVSGLLDPDEVAHFREHTFAAIRAAGVVAGMGFGVGRTAVKTTVDAYRTPGPLRDLAWHPRVGAAAELLAGVPLRVWGGEALIKSPGDENPTLWHDDITFAPLRGRITLNAWIALVDVPTERGALTFIPGSHRRGGSERGTLDDARAQGEDYLFSAWPDLVWAPRVTVPLKAGDATFHQWRTGHTAAGNTSADDRVAFITTYTDVESAYHPHEGQADPDLTTGQRPPDDRFPPVSPRR